MMDEKADDMCSIISACTTSILVKANRILFIPIYNVQSNLYYEAAITLPTASDTISY